MERKGKIVIYQVLPRLYGNTKQGQTKDGSKEENGVGKLSDFTAERLAEIAKKGCTHIWYTGVIEHATQTDYTSFGIAADHPAVVKGKAGSPYAIKDYYDIDPDLADDVRNRVKEFEALIKRTHEAGLKVIMDFVPNHVARHYESDAKPAGIKDLGEGDNKDVRFNRDNNFYYLPGQDFCGQNGICDIKNASGETYQETPCKVTGDDYFANNPGKYQWYETVKLNYGKDYTNNGFLDIADTPDTWTKMRDILLFWEAKGVDGFRCDMAEMVPTEFWQWVIPQIKRKNPYIIFIAETYNPYQYGDYINRGGFDYLYDKVGLYDTLRAIAECRQSACAITDNWKSLNGLAKHMLTFMENHDEQRLPSPHVLGSAVKARPCMFTAATVSIAPTMLYFGQEYGEPALGEQGYSGDDGRTTIFDYGCVPSVQRKLTGKQTKEEKELEEFYSKLLNVCSSNEVFAEGSKFYDLMYVNYENGDFDKHRQYAYIRKMGDRMIFFVSNFSDEDKKNKINMPEHAFDYLGISQGEYTATELMSGKKAKVTFAVGTQVEVEVPAQSGVMLEFYFGKKEEDKKAEPKKVESKVEVKAEAIVETTPAEEKPAKKPRAACKPKAEKGDTPKTKAAKTETTDKPKAKTASAKPKAKK